MVSPILRVPFALFIMTTVSMFLMIQHLRAKQETAKTHSLRNIPLSEAEINLTYPILSNEDKLLLFYKNQTKPPDKGLILHQTWQSHCLPLKKAQLALLWRTVDPSLKYVLWTSKSSEIWFQRHFSPTSKLRKVWNILTLYPEHKVTIFPFILVWVFGGMISDTNIKSIKPITEIFDISMTYFIANEDKTRRDAGYGYDERTSSNFIKPFIHGSGIPNHSLYYEILNNIIETILSMHVDCREKELNCNLATLDISKIAGTTIREYIWNHPEHRPMVYNEKELKEKSCKYCWINSVDVIDAALPCLPHTSIEKSNLIFMPENEFVH